MGAVRHFLRVDPESLERKDVFGRSLGAEVGSYEAHHSPYVLVSSHSP